jgi:hypothetical protein
MTPRLTSRMTVDALLRRVSAAGGFGTVLARGDAQAGAIVLVCAARGRTTALLERTVAPSGDYRWTPCGPEPDDSAALAAYLERRRARDPDLWLIELDIADAERFAAEINGSA